MDAVRFPHIGVATVLLATLLLAATMPAPASVADEPSPSVPTVPSAPPRFGFVPVPGSGEDAPTAFHVAMRGLAVRFAPEGIRYTVEDPDGGAPSTFEVGFEGAPAVAPEGRDPFDHRLHFFRGSDPAAWATDVPSFREVLYRDVYDGVDVRFRLAAGGIKYEVLLAPGADLAGIVLTYRGVRGLEVAGDGLTIRTEAGPVRDTGLVGLQDGGTVPCAFRGLGEHRIGFACPGRDPSRPFVIDPLVYATYLGASGLEFGRAVAVDAAGNAFVAGDTGSMGFPTTPGAFRTAYGGGFYDAFVAKFDPSGATLLWATFLGGGGEDVAMAIALDPQGNVLVAGETHSSDFPTTPGVPDRVWNETDGFVAKLSPAGDALLWSTFLGGEGEDAGLALAVDAASNVFVAGTTSSLDFPVTPGVLDTTIGGLLDGFVAKIAADGASFLYATFLGGAGNFERANGIAVDGAGNAYVTGFTDSPDFPTTVGAFDRTLTGMGDAFVAKLNPSATALVYGTFLGGGAPGDMGIGLAIDGNGTAFVVGMTNSADFPTTPGAFNRTYGGNTDAFVARVNASGSGLLFATYLGGVGEDLAMGVQVDLAGRAYVAGFTASPAFPTTPGAFRVTYGGGTYDAFAVKVNATGSGLSYATFLGGAGTDQAFGLAIDGASNAYVVGATNSTTFPATAGAYDTTANGGFDAFLAKVTLAFPVTVATSPPGLQVEVDGRAYAAPHTFPCEPGSSHVVNAPSPQVAGGTRYAFSSWSDGGARSHAIACTAPATVTASFVATEYEIVVASAPTGLQVRVDGSPFPAPHAFWCLPGSTHTVDTPSPQVVGPSRYLYLAWSDGGAQFHAILCSGPRTVTAMFATEHQVAIGTSPPGLQVLADGVPWATPQTFWWGEGSTHALDVPSPQTQGTTRFVFTAWSDGGAKAHPITVTGPMTLTASFATEYEITVATSPAGLRLVVDGGNVTAPATFWCAAGGTFAVDAPSPQGGPPTRYAFASWSDGGPRAHTVPCSGPQTLTASFSAEFEITLRSVPPGRTVEVDGVPAPAPHAFWCPSGETRQIAAPTPQGTGATRHLFTAWSDGGARSHVVTCTEPATLTAFFATEHEVVVATDPPGLLVIVDGATATAPVASWWAEGSAHSVDVPTPQGGAPTRWAWAAWSDGGGKAHTITVVGPRTLTATFAAEHLVTLTTDPPGLLVTVDGVQYPTPASLWWRAGTTHLVDTPAVQAGAPGVRHAWTAWSDGGAKAHGVGVMGPTTLTATFGTQYRLTATSPHGTPRCDVTDCWYDAGTVAALTIDPFVAGQPGTRHAFQGWTGDATGDAFVTAVPMDGPKTVVATWSTQHFLRVVSPFGTAAGEGWYDQGATASFSVSPTEVRAEGARRYRFAGWTGDYASASASGTVFMDAPKTVVATWEEASGADAAVVAFLLFLLVFAVLLFLAAWYWRRRDREEDEDEAPPEAT